MKYIRVLLLPLIIGGCLSTSPEQQVSVPPASVGRFPQSDLVAEALGLERYPLVDLRSDLGESLIENIENERQLVLDSMNAVKEVIQLRAKDNHNIGRGDHAKPLGCYHAEFTVSSRDVVRADDQAGIAMRENLGRTFHAISVFPILNPRMYLTTDRRQRDSRSK